MRKLERVQKLLVVYSLLAALCIVYTLGQIVLSPSEPDNTLFLGFSALRLVIALGMFFVFCSFVFVSVKVIRELAWAELLLQKRFSESRQTTLWLSGIAVVLGWAGCFLPSYRLGRLENYWLEGRPILISVLFIGLVTMGLLLVTKKEGAKYSLNLVTLKISLPLFLSSLFVMLWMFYTLFGVSSLEDFWYGAGVPILVPQLFIALLGGVVFFHFESRWKSKWAEIMICILIYVLTAYTWAFEPLNRSFLFTGPSRPNQTFYPFVDSAEFDMASQYPLIGENIFMLRSVFFERPLYLSFLVYLHLLFGQNYETLMAVQAGIFAIFPVLIYLIGRSLGFRVVGFSSALVAMFRGVNSIFASNMIDMANPKMILTDFPTAIGIASIILFVCEWLKNPERNRHYPLWVGGIIGFTVMLRTNALILLVLIPVYAFFRLLNNTRLWLTGLCLLFLGITVATLPWEIRNFSLGGQMYGSIVQKFHNVIEQRYQPEFQSKNFQQNNLGFSGILIKNTHVLSALLLRLDVVQETSSCSTVLCFSANHFLHNILTSILVIPTSPVMEELRPMLLHRRPFYWNPQWDGSITSTALLFLIVNLFLVSVGIVFAWRRKHLAGLAPLAVFVAYHFSNALARTSGGRYIVPVDWIVPLYYLIGVYYVVLILMNNTSANQDVFGDASENENSKNQKENYLQKMVFSLLILLGVGATIPLSEKLSQPRYQNINPKETLTTNLHLINNAGISSSDLDPLLQDSNAMFLVGRALYPQYMNVAQGRDSLNFYPYNKIGFSRMEFRLIGSFGGYSVVLPGPPPRYLPHASDVFVIGCKGQDFLDALVVIVLDETENIYIRKPISELQCPLQQPACEDKSVCQ